MILNFNSVKEVQFQKPLDIYLDSKIDFCEHLQNMFKKVNKIISLLCKLRNNLPRSSLVTICKSFINADLDYRDSLYSQTLNNSFHEKLEAVQYNAVLAISETIADSS